MRTHPFAGFLIVCLAVSNAWAQPLGTAFTYQGRLKNGGSPANGSFNMDFRLYSVAAGGTQLASQTLPGVTVSDGLFTVQVDFGPGMFDGNQRWLEVIVNGTPLVPRQSLTAAPNALFAANANQLDGLDSTAFLTSVPNPLSLNGTNNASIIGAQNLSAVNGASGVFGTASAASGQVYGVQGHTESTQGFGVFGVATSTSGPSRGGWFECASPDGNGVFGLAKATTGGPIGVYGQSDAVNGRGVYGYTSNATGDNFGVWGQSNSISGYGVVGVNDRTSGTTYGVYGRSASPDGRAVYGTATASSGQSFGGRFESQSTAGYGVYGHATSSSGSTVGVSGHTASTEGVGVQGYAYNGNGTNWGGYFRSDGSTGRGAYGYANAATGVTMGLYGESASTTGRGVYGYANAATGNTLGVFGQSASTTGRGVFGLANASTGNTFGVFGQSDSTSGRGVYGNAGAGSGATFGGYFETASSGTDATGVFGQASALSGTTYGVWGQSNSTSGYGVIGINSRSSGTTFGVFGRSASTEGEGVFGMATSTIGDAIGVHGETNSLHGTGVYGRANDTSGGIATGVEGVSFSPSGYGVRGIAAALSGTAIGVYGTTFGGGGGWAVYSNGNFGANGAKAFRIDHPDDPANRYLLHYSAESPEVINFYSGKVTLDAGGRAVVELPRYFAKINKDPRYMLTAVGAPMPLLHVAQEIDETALSAGAKAEPGEAAPICSFRIAGGAPGAKVSWRVEALRNDRWVQQRGAPVEVEKQGAEIGTYQHPDLYGQPPEKGMDYDVRHQTRETERSLPATPSGYDANAALSREQLAP